MIKNIAKLSPECQAVMKAHVDDKAAGPSR